MARAGGIFAAAGDLPGWAALVLQLLERRVAKMSKEEPREAFGKMMLALHRDSPRDAAILDARLKAAHETYKPDLENNIITGLGNLLPLKDGVLDEAKAVTVGKTLANLSDESFAVLVYMAQHDPFVQWVMWVLSSIPQEKVGEWLGYAVEVLLDLSRGGKRFALDRLETLFGASNQDDLLRRMRNQKLFLEADIRKEKRKGWWRKAWS